MPLYNYMFNLLFYMDECNRVAVWSVALMWPHNRPVGGTRFLDYFSFDEELVCHLSMDGWVDGLMDGWMITKIINYPL